MASNFFSLSGEIPTDWGVPSESGGDFFSDGVWANVNVVNNMITRIAKRLFILFWEVEIKSNLSKIVFNA